MPFRNGWRVRSRLCIGVLTLLAAACGKDDSSRPHVSENTPPVITGLFFNRPRAHAAEDIVVTAGAEDADGDGLIFRWSATRGDFPLGLGNRTTTWRSPEVRGTDTLTVLVTDREDTVRYRAAIHLVLPEPPPELVVVNATNLADLTWSKSPDEGIDAWSGYEVYAADHSLADLTDEQLGPFRLTPEPITTRAFRAFGLLQGQKYFFQVRAVRRYAEVTERSVFFQEVDVSPRPDGYQSGFGEFTSAYRIAFDLSEGRARALDPATVDPAEIALRDFYLGTTDPMDLAGALRFKSVSLLSNRSSAWSGREVLIKPLEFDWGVSSVTDDGWSTTATVEGGRVYALKTPEGNFAKIRVTGIQNFAPNRTIFMQWAYQTIPGYANF